LVAQRHFSRNVHPSHDYGPQLSWREIARAISAGGLPHWSTVARDFVRYGMLHRPFERRLNDDPPFGKLLHEMVHSAVARRLGHKRAY
jgi:hypothetical protein